MELELKKYSEVGEDVALLQEIEEAKNDPRFANTDESRARFLATLEEIYGKRR